METTEREWYLSEEKLLKLKDDVKRMEQLGRMAEDNLRKDKLKNEKEVIIAIILLYS